MIIKYKGKVKGFVQTIAQVCIFCNHGLAFSYLNASTWKFNVILKLLLKIYIKKLLVKSVDFASSFKREVVSRLL